MEKLNVNSEIGRLKTILLHEPGDELNNLIPDYLEEMLFDDIPWLPVAKKEHEAFAKTFTDNGIKVVYLEDLVAEALNTDLAVKERFIDGFIKEANIKNEALCECVKNYLLSFKDTKQMVLKTMAGIKRSELENYNEKNLADYLSTYPFVTDPMPNLYFARDPFSIVANGVCLNKMSTETRCRETLYGKYIFLYHPIYSNSRLFYNRDEKFSIEGGDILVLNSETLLVGISQRTSPDAIEKLAKNLFFENQTNFKTILAVSIPKNRKFMHLDTILTQVDYDKFTIHKGCYENMRIFALTAKNDKVEINELNDKLDIVLEKYLNKKIHLIYCGGDDNVSSDREQWSDGSNTITIAPGEVITYERNDITNNILESNGIKVHRVPSSELSRGRGGPRCMCMPLEREDI